MQHDQIREPIAACHNSAQFIPLQQSGTAFASLKRNVIESCSEQVEDVHCWCPRQHLQAQTTAAVVSGVPCFV